MTSAVRASQPQGLSSSLPQHAAKTVGARLRQLRKTQDVTLSDLAKDADVDIATISRIETGKMTGTFECHIKLANALGVKLTELYAGIEEVRAKEGVTVQAASEQTDVYVHEAGKSFMTLLTSDILKKKLMPALITIDPAGSTNQEEAKVGTERFLYVLEGTIEAKVGQATHTLKRGSTLYLDASIPHRFHNPGERSAKCLLVTTPPVL